MKDLQVEDLSKVVLASMTEEELAQWYREQGKHIICHQNRYWKETIRGFYEPIHWMAKLSAEQAVCPTMLAWGFRASLCQDDAVVANGSIPVYLLSNLQDYDLNSLSSNRRYQLRKSRKQVNILELTDLALLQEQGYEVFLSASQRVGMSKVPSREQYLASIAHYRPFPHRIVLVGLIDNKLGGYLTGYAVNGTAYLEYLHVDTKVLTTNISLALTFDFVQICRRSINIHEIVHGLHRREDSPLCLFKERIGFIVKHIPSIVSMNPVIGKFLHWQHPHKYYRLTGHD